MRWPEDWPLQPPGGAMTWLTGLFIFLGAAGAVFLLQTGVSWETWYFVPLIVMGFASLLTWLGYAAGAWVLAAIHLVLFFAGAVALILVDFSSRNVIRVLMQLSLMWTTGEWAWNNRHRLWG